MKITAIAHHAYTFLTLFFLISSALILQTSRALAIREVNPNLFLVVSLLFIFIPLPRSFMVGYFMFSVVLFALWIPFWFPLLAGMSIVFASAYGIQRMIAGNSFAKYIITVAFTTPLLYILIRLVSFSFSLFLLKQIGKELLYNVALAVIVWFTIRFAVQFIARYDKTQY